MTALAVAVHGAFEGAAKRSVRSFEIHPFGRGVIQNYALPFLSVIGTGLFASLRASDTGSIS